MLKTRLIKLAAVVAFAFILTGCGAGLYAASYNEEAVTKEDGSLMTVGSGIFERPVITKSRTSKVGALAESKNNSITALAAVEEQRLVLETERERNRGGNRCDTLSAADLLKFDLELQKAYLAQVMECVKETKLYAMVDNMTTTLKAFAGNKSDIATVSRNAENTIVEVSHDTVETTSAVLNPLASTFKVKLGVDAVKNAQDRHHDTAAAGFDNSGSYTVGDINVSQDQINGAQSNDIAGGLASESGVPGAQGPASGTSTNTRGDSAPVAINLGKGNRVTNTTTTDNARAIVDADASPIAEPSSNLSNISDSKSQGGVTCEECDPETEVDDRDGVF